MFTFLKRHLAGTANIISLLAVLIVIYSFLKVVEIDVKLSNNIEEQKRAENISDQRLSDLESELQKTRNDVFTLNSYINEKSANLEKDLGSITSSVDTLKKLNDTDKELLQKYSKVYFLNENYVPSDLSDIGRGYLSDPTRELQIHTNVRPYLEDMLDSAKKDNVVIKVVSAYRSFGTQTALKASYTVSYGSGANKFSADQGYSEHQLGTTVDLTSTENNLQLDGFDKTDAYQWLLEHAWEYGFTLSYPQGNAYYQYEPWHWRFVGKDLARRLYRDGIHFYDLDQREIDKYLVNVF